MIVTRGLGRSVTRGAIVAFGLGRRTTAIVVPPVAAVIHLDVNDENSYWRRDDQELLELLPIIMRFLECQTA